MAKGTVIFLFILSGIAFLLIGFNWGKKYNPNSFVLPEPSPTPDKLNPTLTPTPSFLPEEVLPTIASESGKTTGSKSTYTDKKCGFSFSYPGSYLKQKSTNGQSSIFTNPDNEAEMIAVACEQTLPKPPLAQEKIANIKIGGIMGKIYHDQNAKDGTPRDEVFVTHPTNGMEIIIAGYGKTYQAALSSFKFMK
jgi:hypothetical protein